LATKTILILGGYGNFGKRISESLAIVSDCKLIISGRNISKAERFIKRLAVIAKSDLEALELDILAPYFESRIKKLKIDIVIHTCGPFQGQDYSVAQACLNIGAHYIDLADDRKFVCNFESLNEQARKKQLLLVSGASSVPGLSSTVIDQLQSNFQSIDSIDIAIAPGNKAERGEATVRAILSYTGYPIKIFKDAQWKDVYGWMNPEKIDFSGIVGRRWLANVEVPDLSLFPKRYNVAKRVSFKAGLELSLLHLTMVAMAYLVKIGLVKSWAPLSKWIVKISDGLKFLGSDKGAMQILINGKDSSGKAIWRLWRLYADNGVGPYIPCVSAILVVKKIISGELKQVGAMPCMGLFDLSEFESFVERWGIYSEQTHGEKTLNGSSNG